MSGPRMRIRGRPVCPTCRLVLPEDVRDPADCPRCRAEAEARAAEEERARRRAEEEAARARLGTAPLTRLRARIYWGLAALEEDLAAALRYVPEAEEERFRAALGCLARMRGCLGLPGVDLARFGAGFAYPQGGIHADERKRKSFFGAWR